MKTIAIVNPGKYTGYGYIRLISNHYRGYKMIGIYSSPDAKPPVPNRVIHLLDTEIIFDGDYQGLVEQLQQFNPQCFLVGDDLGFPLADRLQHHFFPQHSNDPDKHLIRIDKLRGFKHLEERGLVDFKQFLLTPESATGCASGEWVIKPTVGAGNVDVHIKPSYHTITQLASSGNQYMAQQYLEGPEYCIEIFVCGGEYKCTMASLYKGEHLVDGIYPWREENELISPELPVVAVLYEYMVPIIKELGVKLGLTWSQIKVDSNGTPRLVEINYRSQGHGLVGAIHAATGNNWATESLRGYLGLNTNTSTMYRKLGDFNKICVNNTRQRHVESIDWSRIDSLVSLSHREERSHFFPGIMPVSKDFSTVMGMIMIQNNDSVLYKQDMDTINLWKQELQNK